MDPWSTATTGQVLSDLRGVCDKIVELSVAAWAKEMQDLDASRAAYAARVKREDAKRRAKDKKRQSRKR
jgi:hypothetical protein